MSELYSVISKQDPEYLVADPTGARKIGVPVKPNIGVVHRGTILKRGEDGMFEPADAEGAVTTNYLVVTDEEVDTSVNQSIAEDVAAYESGILFRDKVFLKDDAEVTAEVELVLRKQNILLRGRADAEASFNNSLFGEKLRAIATSQEVASGVRAGELQDGVAIHTDSISGHLKWYSDGPALGFPDLTDGGNFVALHMERAEGEEATLEITPHASGTGAPKPFDESNDWIIRVTDPKHQIITIVRTKDENTATEVYSLAKLIYDPQPAKK